MPRGSIIQSKVVTNKHRMTIEQRHNNLRLIACKTIAPISKKLGEEMPPVETYLKSKKHHLLVLGNHASKPLHLIKRIIETLEVHCTIDFRDRVQEHVHPGVCDEQLFMVFSSDDRAKNFSTMTDLMNGRRFREAKISALKAYTIIVVPEHYDGEYETLVDFADSVLFVNSPRHTTIHTSCEPILLRANNQYKKIYTVVTANGDVKQATVQITREQVRLLDNQPAIFLAQLGYSISVSSQGLDMEFEDLLSALFETDHQFNALDIQLQNVLKHTHKLKFHCLVHHALRKEIKNTRTIREMLGIRKMDNAFKRSKQYLNTVIDHCFTSITDPSMKEHIRLQYDELCLLMHTEVFDIKNQGFDWYSIKSVHISRIDKALRSLYQIRSLQLDGNNAGTVFEAGKMVKPRSRHDRLLDDRLQHLISMPISGETLYEAHQKYRSLSKSIHRHSRKSTTTLDSTASCSDHMDVFTVFKYLKISVDDELAEPLFRSLCIPVDGKVTKDTFSRLYAYKKMCETPDLRDLPDYNKAANLPSPKSTYHRESTALR